jgi:hypothetical protein
MLFSYYNWNFYYPRYMQLDQSACAKRTLQVGDGDDGEAVPKRDL